MKTAKSERSQPASTRVETRKTEKVAHASPVDAKQKFFALVAGGWIGIALVKLGNPVIFDRLVTPPQNFAEFIFTSWPIA